MNTKTASKTPERDDIEALLPWHAAGTLSRRDTQRVEQALERDPALKRQYALVREELGETIHLNETLGAPSARAMEKLLAGIEKESGPARRRRPAFSLSAWIAEKLSALSPRTLTWATAAAAMVIVVQAGLLGSLYIGEEAPGYRGVDIGTGTPKSPVTDPTVGTYAFVGFVPSASSGDITNFLAANNMAVVDGPRAGGLYRVRIAPAPLNKDAVNTLTSRLRENRTIVSMVLPAD